MSDPDTAPSSQSDSDVVQNVRPDQLRQLVTRIKSAEQQIGEHVIAALQQPDTVAALTMVAAGQDGQRIISVALDETLVQQVQHLLAGAQAQRQEEAPCLGFHCYVKPRATEGEAP